MRAFQAWLQRDSVGKALAKEGEACANSQCANGLDCGATDQKCAKPLICQ